VPLKRTSNQSTVVLGRELGRGGEGAVHLVNGAPDVVAKIYLKAPAPNKVEKLRSMARRASPALLRVAAWPVDVLVDDGTTARGFLMQKISAREDLHQLYSPKSRRRAFPNVDFRFVVRVAANVARAFAQVHALGHVIGDVNHGNALVGRDGTVVLIDCDSFQIRDGARQFTCDVGVPLFTPPELAGRPFRGLRRDTNHDAFGLAVLVFHLLFGGRHPFAGRHVDGEMPIERAIAEHRFAYGAGAAAAGMTRPPGTLPLEAFGAAIARLFELAFARPGDAPRPTAAAWVEALQTLESELVVCEESPAHVYRRPDPGAGPGCCWCEMERSTGVRLFSRELANVAAAGAAQLARAWDAILAIPKPDDVEPMQMLPPQRAKTSSDDPLGGPGRGIVALGLVALMLAGPMAGSPTGVVISIGSLLALGAMLLKQVRRDKKPRLDPPRKRALLAARAQWNAAVKRWNATCSDQGFVRQLGELSLIKSRLLELPKQRARRLKELHKELEQRQRDEFLDRFRIDQAKLRSVTPQDLATLASWGVETAEDYLRLAVNLPGSIARATLTDISRWATDRMSEFRYDPALEGGSRELRDYDARLQSQQDKLLSSLTDGEAALRRLVEDVSRQRVDAQRDLATARSALDELESTR